MCCFGGKRGVFCKLDIEKAYDNLDGIFPFEGDVEDGFWNKVD